MKNKIISRVLLAGGRFSLLAGLSLLVFGEAKSDFHAAGGIAWTNLNGGDWNLASNWQPHQVPGPLDNAMTAVPGTYTIAITSSVAVANLVIGGGGGVQTLLVSGGGLTLGGLLQIVGTGHLELQGGTVKGGTIASFANGEVSSSGGMLDGVALDANLTIASGGGMSVTNGLTLLHGSRITLNSAGNGTYLLLRPGTQLIGGDGQIVLSGNSSAVYLGNGGGPTALTFGPGIMVRGRGGIIENVNSSLVNQGTLQADVPGQNLSLRLSTFSNTGTLAATAGATLLSEGQNNSSDGSLVALDGGMINMRGTVDLNGLHELSIPQSSTLRLGQALLGSSTRSDLFNVLGTVVFDGGGSVSDPRLLEAMGQDLGSSLGGFVNNFVINTLQVTSGSYVKLVDESDNSPGSGPEALYLDTLVVAEGATLDLNNLPLYVRHPQVFQGTVINGNITSTAPPVPHISVNPASPAVGDTVTLTASAEGAAPFQYQWRFNGQTIPGAVNPIHTINNAQVADSGSYSCVIVNAFGGTYTDTIDLRVGTLPDLILVDAFADRILYTDEAKQGVAVNTTATREIGEPLHAGKAGGHSVWLSWRATRNGIATFKTAGSSFDTLLAIYTGSSLANLAVVTSDEDAGGYFTSMAKFNARKDTEYQIAIDGFGGATGRIVLTWELAATEDELPQVTVSPASRTLRNHDNLELEVEIDNATSSTKYQWTFNGAPIQGAVAPKLDIPNATVTNVGSYRVIVTSGTLSVTTEPAYIEIADETGPPPEPSQDKFRDLLPAEPPQGLRARRAGGGGFPIVAAGVAGFQNINNFGATTESGEPVFAGLGVQSGASRWYKLTPLESATFVIDTIGSEIDTILGVYTGTDLSNLQAIVQDDNSAPDHIRSRVQFPAVAQTPYLILVAGVNGAQGTIKLNWLLGSPPPVIIRFDPASPPRVVNGVFEARLIGAQAGKTLLIQTSTDLKSWSQVSSSTGGGTIQLSEPVDGARHFYRAIEP